MLTDLVVENFKAFGNRQEIPLAPLTLVFGGNSAGKSTLIQALLLLRQSLVPSRSIPLPTQRGADLVVRGDHVDLGSFDALVHGHARDLAVTLGIGIPMDFTHGPSQWRSDTAIRERARHSPSNGVEWTYTRPEKNPEITHAKTTVTRGGGRVDFFPSPRPEGRGPMGGDFATLSPEETIRLWQWTTELVGPRTKGIPAGARAVLRLASGIPVEVIGFESADRHVVLTSDEDDVDEPQQIEELRRRSRNDETLEALNIWLRAGPMLARRALQQTSYLGPMRAAPERLSILTGERVTGVGVNGGQVVHLLAQSPELLREVNGWLETLEIPYSTDIRQVSDSAVAGAIGEVHCLLLRDRRTGIEVAPTDVGYGIGQVLPVVVQSILQRRGTLCIEQPEIHLHPALQGRLADLFASLVRPDDPRRGWLRPQFILETHSEHLILRLQRLIRQGRLSHTDLSVLHVGHRDEATPTVRQLRLNESGEFIDEWPEGFFDERLADLLDSL